MSRGPSNPNQSTTTNKFPPLWALAALSLALAGCYPGSLTDPTAPTLNSERIQQQFGSYGIELLHQDTQVRVSNLYSTDTGTRTCRTLAIVRLASPVPAELAAPHAEILAGGSIGAVLSHNGWQVVKQRLDLDEFEVMTGSRAAVLMRLSGPTMLAADLYELSARQGKRALNYAVIAEIHHPDYLTLAQLRSLPVRLGANREAASIFRLAEQIATETIRQP